MVPSHDSGVLYNTFYLQSLHRPNRVHVVSSSRLLCFESGGESYLTARIYWTYTITSYTGRGGPTVPSHQQRLSITLSSHVITTILNAGLTAVFNLAMDSS